uniref:DNA-directed RNA polymerase n=1 Tax=Mallomonas splendens TaxID=52552 RepID=A0A3G2QZG6_9STRA|nr:RNA polymerase beta'' subunit [Mallomonas splendens]AYO28507.1 RNA polymerase beta'' subunit [Mallomonas splendens]
MLLTQTVTKKLLETLVHETFTQFGNFSSSSLLDSLKLLGFYYATIAGISINIEDLKTPDTKKKFLENANFEIEKISKDWQQGFISDTERFQTIIDIWNIATESLKNRIIDYYQHFDPANNLYIMAFSGARGNISQVRQLVGMRGLMSDQEGKIIDLPIQTNFREGLSSIDYIISSYGARKGIVDTALKTADSGYLTRRLIYIAQDLVIRELNCGTTEGIIILLKKNSNIKNLIGRTLIYAKSQKNFFLQDLNLSLKEVDLIKLKKSAPVQLNVRSSLTCKSNGSICQKCYGWDLAQQKLISLGEAVGILAAQSIGEPGTQLTMRTFHTGGIFTGETTKQIFAPFSGKLILPSSLKTVSYRTNHGILVLKLQQESNLIILNWSGKQEEIFLNIGSYLYISTTQFVKKGQVIAEYSLRSFLTGTRKLKPIYTSLAGEIKFENLLVRKINHEKRTIKVNEDDGVLWIASGKIFPLPKEVKYLFPNTLNKKKAFAKLKIISPYSGFLRLTKTGLILICSKGKIKIDFDNLVKNIPNCSFKFSFITKNSQYIDSYTVLGFLELFSNDEGKIYSLRKKESFFITTFFIVIEADVWKINSDQINNFSFFETKKTIVRSGKILNTSSHLSRSGFFLKKDGFKMIFQHAIPIFLTRGTILKYKQGDFVFEKKVLATLINYTQQTEDIVQGLPKIEELIEARKPKNKAYLAFKPGIFLTDSLSQETIPEKFERKIEGKVIKCTTVETRKKITKVGKKKKKKHKLFGLGKVFI